MALSSNVTYGDDDDQSVISGESHHNPEHPRFVTGVEGTGNQRRKMQNFTYCTQYATRCMFSTKSSYSDRFSYSFKAFDAVVVRVNSTMGKRYTAYTVYFYTKRVKYHIFHAMCCLGTCYLLNLPIPNTILSDSISGKYSR